MVSTIRPCVISIFRRARYSVRPQCGHLSLLYATSRLSVYEGHMIVLAPISRPKSSRARFSRLMWRATAGVALLGLGFGLAGCAGMSDSMTTAFADPAKYEFYDCKQLEAERKNLASRGAELQ